MLDARRDTFYLSGADRVSRRASSMDDYVFNSIDDWKKLEQYWRKRGEDLLKDSDKNGSADIFCEVI